MPNYEKVNGLCKYLTQECNRGDQPCPGIQAEDLAGWKREAEGKVDCPFRGSTLSKKGYKDRVKKVTSKGQKRR